MKFFAWRPALFSLGLAALTAPAAEPEASAARHRQTDNPAGLTPGPSGPLAIFEALCQTLLDYYPMLDLTGLSGSTWQPAYRARVNAAPNDQAAMEIMHEMVCRLNDYHTWFTWPGRPRLIMPPLRVAPVLASPLFPADYGIWGQTRPGLELPSLDGVAIAIVEAPVNSGLQAGDEILGVDGQPIAAALRPAWAHSIGSSAAGRLADAAEQMLRGPVNRAVQLTVRRQAPGAAAQTITVDVSRSGVRRDDLITSREEAGIPVIRITRWENDGDRNLVTAFDQLLERAREKPGLIIDVRGNGGGSDDLASEIVGRFIAEPIIASISFHRQTPTLKFDRTVDWTQPRGPWRYRGRIAVLTDEGCMSACEHFVSGMIEAGALVCGSPTSGACGWSRMVDLPGGARLRVARTFPLHTGGVPSPQLGMAPHIWAPHQLADLRAGRDTALLAALAWIQSSSPLPPRLQPLSPFSRQ